MRILRFLLALAGLAVVGWACITAWGAVLHGHPAYAVMLVVTVVVALGFLWRSLADRPPSRGWWLVGAIAGMVVWVAWLAAVVWLRPFPAVEPALTAMESTATVRVVETPTDITLLPGLDLATTGLFFQPGARVDARAYAAILRPLADAGFPVVIAKQPLGIGFLAPGAFEAAREANPEVTRWIVGGHSLGGTVAAIEAEEHDSDDQAPVTGLLLYASYPASDMSASLTASVLSLYATNDGLATPADIEASRASLPPDAEVIPIEGAVHAFFGDYGAQPGDGTPTVDQDVARSQIARESLEFVSRGQLVAP